MKSETTAFERLDNLLAPKNPVAAEQARTIIAVSIVSYDCADHVIDCLRALRASHLRPMIIHVCENAGPAAYSALIQAVVTRFNISAPLQRAANDGATKRRACDLTPSGPRVVFHCAAQNLGYAGGVNLCIRALDGSAWDGVLVLNPDATVAPDAIGHLSAYASKGAYGVVGCRLIFAETGRVQMFGGRWRPWLGRAVNLGLDAPGDVKPDVLAVERELDYVCGGAMFVTRAYCDAVGLMDEDYFLYMEEVDFCFRRGSFRLGYAHDAIVTHLHGATTGASRDARLKSPLTIYLSERNKLRFTRRFFPSRYPVVIVTSLCLTLLYLKRAGVRAFSVALAGWLAGVLGETGRPRRVLS